MQKSEIGDVTSEGRRLIDGWTAAVTNERRVRTSLDSASQSRAAAEQALAKWLLPHDAKPGETIAIWYGDGLIQVENTEPPTVSIRTRGRQHDLP